ncbi:uncharacterized protein LOC101858702 [Aplysia californica]|uniref:Uncharacterized protein LOC101858702 n=1 Tax=Aplysia californica TaxID=6500 RepID=A0ABM0ZWM9_APLCA|nr:uncharacterized protein LOC101858702 [Aplysia californica]XP_035824749.1 uncharacterized protein LOC101858702 [Aplysia californica]
MAEQCGSQDSDCGSFEKGDTEDHTLERLRLAAEARLTQGVYEVEVSYGGEADLHREKGRCGKNPGHKNFIPSPQFSLTHLPAGFQDKQLLETIGLCAQLTVRLVVNYTSMSRPEFLPNSKSAYPFSRFRGKTVPYRFGSGWLFDAFPRGVLGEGKGGECPCSECGQSGKPSSAWYELMFLTALHVVFDSEESKATDVELFYDSDVDRDSTVLKLAGGCVEMADIETDGCLLVCWTHDLDLGDKLQALSRQRWDLMREINMRYTREERGGLVVVVSHPHGCSKQVTVGWAVDRSDWTGLEVYRYSADTCPGSSGAGMWPVGWADPDFSILPHSKGVSKGVNECSPGVVVVD